MAPLFPGHPYSPQRWLRRLDRAAARLNPILTIVAIGLVILNLTCLALLAPWLPLSRHPGGLFACQPPAIDGEAATQAPTYSAMMPD